MFHCGNLIDCPPLQLFHLHSLLLAPEPIMLSVSLTFSCLLPLFLAFFFFFLLFSSRSLLLQATFFISNSTCVPKSLTTCLLMACKMYWHTYQHARIPHPTQGDSLTHALCPSWSHMRTLPFIPSPPRVVYCMYLSFLSFMLYKRSLTDEHKCFKFTVWNVVWLWGQCWVCFCCKWSKRLNSGVLP